MAAPPDKPRIDDPTKLPMYGAATPPVRRPQSTPTAAAIKVPPSVTLRFDESGSHGHRSLAAYFVRCPSSSSVASRMRPLRR